MSNISYGFQYRNASDVNLDFPGKNFYDTHPQHNNKRVLFFLTCNIYNLKNEKEKLIIQLG